MEIRAPKGNRKSGTQFKNIHKGESAEGETRQHPNLKIIHIGRSEVSRTNAAPILPLWKRVLDIIGASIGLIFALPVIAFFGLLIKVVSKGPIFFKQERVGFRGKTFTMWKLRTYEVAAESSSHELHLIRLITDAQEDDTKSRTPMKKLDSHPGIIPFGNVLRKTAIDELPQLFNVLLGDMSLVGPRPAIPYEVEQYSPRQRERLQAVPGLTGLWQVSGKNRLSFNEMVDLDVSYWVRKCLLLDIVILLKTPSAIVMQLLDTVRERQEGISLEDEVASLEGKSVAAVEAM